MESVFECNENETSLIKSNEIYCYSGGLLINIDEVLFIDDRRRKRAIMNRYKLAHIGDTGEGVRDRGR